MFYDITVERIQTFAFSVEAANQKEAERLGLAQFQSFDATANDVTVQSRAVSMEITKPLSHEEVVLRLVR
jgi:hypothetical protein